MNTVTVKTVTELDGFASGYSEPLALGGGSSGANVPSGEKLKFTNAAVWTDPNGDVVRAKLVALNVINRVQKWPGDGGPPVETITLEPGEAWPDIAALNERCKHEWYEKFGKLVGPWMGEHVVLFFDPANMTRYWWPSPTQTIGACICVRSIIEQTQLMRRFKKALVYPLVELSHTHMNTQFGGRERPHLDIK